MRRLLLAAVLTMAAATEAAAQATASDTSVGRSRGYVWNGTDWVRQPGTTGGVTVDTELAAAANGTNAAPVFVETANRPAPTTGKVNCATTATAFTASSVPSKDILVMGVASGTAKVAIGSSSVTFDDGLLLTPSGVATSKTSNVNLMYCRTATATKELRWMSTN